MTLSSGNGYLTDNSASLFDLNKERLAVLSLNALGKRKLDSVYSYQNQPAGIYKARCTQELIPASAIALLLFTRKKKV
jgi:hypothetical protein